MLPNGDKWIIIYIWGYVSVFTKVHNMMKNQHFNQAELSLGQYLLVIAWLYLQHNCLNKHRVISERKQVTLSSSQVFLTHGS